MEITQARASVGKVDAIAVRDQVRVRMGACYACSVRCKKVVHIEQKEEAAREADAQVRQALITQIIEANKGYLEAQAQRMAVEAKLGELARRTKGHSVSANLDLLENNAPQTISNFSEYRGAERAPVATTEAAPAAC